MHACKPYIHTPLSLSHLFLIHSYLHAEVTKSEVDAAATQGEVLQLVVSVLVSDLIGSMLTCIFVVTQQTPSTNPPAAQVRASIAM